MASAFLRRVTSLASNQLPFHFCKLPSSRPRAAPLRRCRAYSTTDRLHLSPLFPRTNARDAEEYKIESMDEFAWQASSGFAFDALLGDNGINTPEVSHGFDYNDDYDPEIPVGSSPDEPDFDEIEDMRFRRNLFYKLDKDSKEYEEYKFDFHRRIASKNEKEQRSKRENAKKEIRGQRKNEHLATGLRKTEDSCKKIADSSVCNNIKRAPLKKQRTLTFNQLTGPYHEPFCLDIYVSKGSVRASVVHRATSKVVAVAHSISKDMKYDSGSTKNRNACVAVGEVLARRALADDIYNVVYVPRKGDKLEGKLRVVLEAIVNYGVDVKVKLKQRNSRKTVKNAGFDVKG